MMMHAPARMYMSLGIALTLVGCARPERRQRPDEVRAPAVVDAAELAADGLRDRLLALDVDGCARDGEALVQQHPESARLRAWWIGCVSAAGRHTEAEALAAAMLAERAGDPWAEFARVAAWIEEPRFPAEALPMSEALVATLGEHPDAVLLRARTLLARHRTAELSALAAAHPEALAWARAYSLLEAAYRDRTRLPEALAVAHEVAPTRPEFVRLADFTARWLTALERPVEALEWVDAGLARAPDATWLRQQRWTLLRRQPGWSEDEGHQAVLEDILSTLEGAGDRPDVLLAAAETYRALGLVPRAEPLEARILAEHGGSPAAEALLYQRLEAGAKDAASGAKDPEIRELRRAMLAAFLARPRHHDPSRPETVARWQFDAVLADPASTPDAILATVEEMRARRHTGIHDVYAYGLQALTERTPYLARAEALAREGIDAIEAYAAVGARAGFEASDLMRRDALAFVHDALAGGYLAAGRLDEAAEALARVESLTLAPTPSLKLKLSELARRRGDLDRAEEHLAAGIDLEGHRADDNRCRLALEALYRQRHGSTRGFSGHLEELAGRSRARRKAAILAGFKGEAAAPPAFALRSLDGREVTSRSLRGKIAIVHFWFKTCTGCLLEMPEFQAYVDAHARDPDLAVVTLHYGGKADEVAAWMRERGHRFEVLMDDGYSERAGVTSFPTTWFLDQEGRLRFTTDFGTSRHLREEFDWRIEAVRAGGVAVDPSGAAEASPRGAGARVAEGAAAG